MNVSERKKVALKKMLQKVDEKLSEYATKRHFEETPEPKALQRKRG